MKSAVRSGHLPRVSPNSLEDLPRSTHRAARRARSFGWWGASSSHMRRRGMRPWLQCRERGPGPVPRPAKLVKAAGAGWSPCASTAPSTSMTSSPGPATWFQVSIIARMNSAVLKAISDLKESAWSPIHLTKAIWDEDAQLSKRHLCRRRSDRRSSARHSDCSNRPTTRRKHWSPRAGHSIRRESDGVPANG